MRGLARISWLVLATLFLLLPGLAQAATGPTGSLEPGQILRGRFVQERHLEGFSAPLRSEGHFVLVAAKGLLWQAEKPFPVSTVITAQGLVQQVGGSETMRLSAARLPFLAGLYQMLGGALTGNWQALEKQFDVARSGTPQHWQVQLTPHNGPDPVSMPFQTIVARGSRFVDAVSITRPGGDRDELTFLDQQLSVGPLAVEEESAFAGAGT